ncbi:uroporphyrinogen-III C-methyltransferase [Roseivirga thermotolerans]|uniref:uroporphyrinogen-III C-methyltransferase n=1 Tax=Roseivirga thermotolerans TaxID=1758176 RepID=A0ABQ3I669_9BACT|nr:uroporphyrinogen-III C-methyltransferase [Roseivirga thermotolerans]GHE65627.1 uroporphyrinogen-III C-methyltransferase [Roseivirga thermotolerans]
MTITPKLSLVGAGPGDPELITVKAIKTLAEADVVLYDDLASKALLCYVKKGGEKIYVGKRVGKHSHTQQAINELIVHFAQTKGHVVRLKGGDPFIFGRGYEELDFARQFGIPCQIIPGISSAHAVPALQEIPMTSRGYSQSYWVVTATTKEGFLTPDIHLAAQSTATVVILMGTKKLAAICDTFREHGRHNAPVAIIQNGSLPSEKIVTATINSIEDEAFAHGISSPAIIIVGEVVKLGKSYLRQIEYATTL